MVKSTLNFRACLYNNVEDKTQAPSFTEREKEVEREVWRERLDRGSTFSRKNSTKIMTFHGESIHTKQPSAKIGWHLSFASTGERAQMSP